MGRIKITKIHVGFEIKEPYPLYVEPGSPIEGKIIVTNNGKKDQKLKEVAVELYEVFEEKYTDEYGPDYKLIKKPYGRYPYKTLGLIKAGEEQVYDFQIMLPRWKRTKGKKIYSWRMELWFKQKTKMMSTRGSIRENATCILPVETTELVPTFGDPMLVNQKKVKKKK